MTKEIEVSAVVPVCDRFDATGLLVREYLSALEKSGKSFELVYVLDGNKVDLARDLASLASKERKLRVIQLANQFGEATALSAGIEYTTGTVIVTLPAYYQVEAPEITRLVTEFDDCDMAVAARWPRAAASKFEVFRRKAFHWLVKGVTGSSFNDLGCGVRALKRNVAEEVPIYGDQHRFLPLLASRRGFVVREVQLRQSDKDRHKGGYGARVYIRRILDILTVFFLVRFTKKPLRFFGMIGSITFLMGTVFLAYVVIERLFFGIALADRPALLLSSLLVVLGLQIFALGLLGELIIFTHARELKEYAIEKIVN
jgi:glycosyltransferase involved in cell wall biosynthesis